MQYYKHLSFVWAIKLMRQKKHEEFGWMNSIYFFFFFNSSCLARVWALQRTRGMFLSAADITLVEFFHAFRG